MNSGFKNKIIVVYIALAHHTRFLTPVMKRLEQSGARIIYIIGQGERSQEITAIEKGLDYVHVFDYVGHDDRDDVDENYRILRDGLANGIKRDIAIGSTNALTVLDKTLYAAAKEYIGFKNFLEKERPDICFALHELNRWGKMLAFRAKRMGIPMLTLQEGLYVASNYLFIGHVQYSTLNLVWGRKTQQKLIGYEAPGERIIPVGNTHIAQEIITLGKANTRSVMRREMNLDEKNIVLVMFSSALPPLEDLKPLFKGLQENPNTQLVCKFHPVTDGLLAKKWKEQIPKSLSQDILFFHGEKSTYALMAMSDLCVLTEPSTTGLEALAIGKPLVQLKLSTPDRYPYDFVKDKVALHLTPEELAEKLSGSEDLSAALPAEARDQFIKEELIDTTGAADRIVAITRNILDTISHPGPASFPLKDPVPPDAPDWSIVIPVYDTPELFLAVLEAVSAFSENAGTYEVLLVLQEEVSQQIRTILDALEGDITLVPHTGPGSIVQGLNKGAEHSRGKRLVFFNRHISPADNWLKNLGNAYERHANRPLFGARIITPHQNIIHAGMVVDANNSPVSAYAHLDEKFPSALKERPFQMLDHFLSMDRSFFSELGGFHSRAGRFCFMDFCLRANEVKEEQAGFYIPDVKLTRLISDKINITQDESIYFFSKWHRVLWESEGSLYETDNVSQLQLDSARMTRAMNMLGR